MIEALYELKQAARAYTDHLCRMLKALGFRRSDSDEYFIYCDRRTIFLSAYVGDFLKAGPALIALRLVAEKLSETVELSIDKRFERFLGIGIVRSSERTTIFNSLLMNSITQEFFMEDTNDTQALIAAGKRIENDEGIPVIEAPYQEFMGTFLYLVNIVRPDIAFAVGQLSSFSSDPLDVHWTAAKRVVRYLKETRMMGIEYKKDLKAIIRNSDSDFAGDFADQKYTTGFLFELAGGVVS